MISAILHIGLVVNMHCSAVVVRSRILRNVGGDRSGRTDDSPEFIRNKLKIYRSRTLPLLDHYRRNRVRVLNLQVTPMSSNRDHYRKIEAFWKQMEG